jgi:hypothetical protein
VAFDPVAIQNVLRAETGRDVTVERIAIGNMTLRLSEALLATYLERRGAPKIVILETAFMTQRTIKRLEPAADGKPPEHYLLARDLNLMTFAQLVAQPAVAMPFTEPEARQILWHIRLRAAILRAGALVYQFAKVPFEDWSLDACDRNEFTRESTWPADFAFSYGDYRIDGALPGEIAGLRKEVETLSVQRDLREWQTVLPEDRTYPYDFEAAYRKGEMTYFLEMVHKAEAGGARVLVIPMPLFGYDIDPADLAFLEQALPDRVEFFDIYAKIGTDISKFWYDDAHVEKFPTGVLTTALLAERLLPLIEAGSDLD